MADSLNEASQIGADEVASLSSPEFERLLRLAKSYIDEAENKINDIKSAKNARLEEEKGGTIRSTMSAGLAQGRLESAFEEDLKLAWSTAEKAKNLWPDGEVVINELFVRPNIVFAYVLSLRGDLQLELGESKKAIAFYNEALEFWPDNEIFLHSLAVAYTNTSQPELAKQNFKKVVEIAPLEPIGIDAAKMLDKLERGSIGNKSFRGSWKILATLAAIAIIAFFVHAWLFCVIAIVALAGFFYINYK